MLGRMWESAQPLAMASEQKAQLQAWIKAPLTPQKIVLRSRICLLAHEGIGNRQIARQLDTSRPTVLLWRERFAASGVAGLEHEPPRKPSGLRLDEDLIKKIDLFVSNYNPKSKPFAWTANADSILQKIERLCKYISETRH